MLPVTKKDNVSTLPEKGENMTMSLPKDPMILVSYINTQLRDFYPSLEELCKSLDIEQTELTQKLASVDYHYHPDRNQFV